VTMARVAVGPSRLPGQAGLRLWFWSCRSRATPAAVRVGIRPGVEKGRAPPCRDRWPLRCCSGGPGGIRLSRPTFAPAGGRSVGTEGRRCRRAPRHPCRKADRALMGAIDELNFFGHRMSSGRTAPASETHGEQERIPAAPRGSAAAQKVAVGALRWVNSWVWRAVGGPGTPPPGRRSLPRSQAVRRARRKGGFSDFQLLRSLSSPFHGVEGPLPPSTRGRALARSRPAFDGKWWEACSSAGKKKEEGKRGKGAADFQALGGAEAPRFKEPRVRACSKRGWRGVTGGVDGGGRYSRIFC